jgi:plastocyanin
VGNLAIPNMLRIGPTLLLAALLTTAPSAHGAEVRGRVVVRGTLPPRPEGARTYYWSLDNGVLAPREDRIFPERDLAIVLAQRGRAAARGDGAPVIIRIAEGGMMPAAAAVRTGSLVRFQNDDPFTHELWSPTHSDFAAESMAPGQTRPLVVPGSGQVEIRCKRAPHMRGFVAVVDASYVVTPAADGSFTVQADPGTYTVRVFFEGRWLAESELVVNADRNPPAEIVVDASTARPRPAAPAAAPAATPPAAPAAPGAPAASAAPAAPPAGAPPAPAPAPPAVPR